MDLHIGHHRQKDKLTISTMREVTLDLTKDDQRLKIRKANGEYLLIAVTPGGNFMYEHGGSDDVLGEFNAPRQILPTGYPKPAKELTSSDNPQEA